MSRDIQRHIRAKLVRRQQLDRERLVRALVEAARLKAEQAKATEPATDTKEQTDG